MHHRMGVRQMDEEPGKDQKRTDEKRSEDGTVLERKSKEKEKKDYMVSRKNVCAFRRPVIQIVAPAIERNTICNIIP